jgi:hypothetical protein
MPKITCRSRFDLREPADPCWEAMIKKKSARCLLERRAWNTLILALTIFTSSRDRQPRPARNYFSQRGGLA